MFTLSDSSPFLKLLDTYSILFSFLANYHKCYEKNFLHSFWLQICLKILFIQCSEYFSFFQNCLNHYFISQLQYFTQCATCTLGGKKCTLKANFAYLRQRNASQNIWLRSFFLSKQILDVTSAYRYIVYTLSHNKGNHCILMPYPCTGDPRIS